MTDPRRIAAAIVSAFLGLILLSSAAGAAGTHTIRKGETLSSIAQAHGVTIDALRQANKIKNEDLIRAGQTLAIPDAAPTSVAYTIRKGDSLSTIGDRHGITAKRLAAYNGIRNLNKIVVGQTIRIPIDGAAPRGPQLDADTKAVLDRIRPRSGQWNKIIIHHSGTDQGSGKSFDRYHREERRMENGLAYHFLIGNGYGMRNGEIYIGDRWRRQIHGGHMESSRLNEVAIGICLVGNFEKRAPSSAQMDQLAALVNYLANRCGVRPSNVTTHTLAHPSHTQCPGGRFSLAALKRDLEP